MFRTVTPIASILLAILLFMFFVQPQYTEIKTLRRDRDDYRTATKNYEAFSAKLQELTSQKNALSISETERLDEFIPSEIDSTMLLVKLENMAKKHNMLFGNIKADDEAGKDLSASAGNADIEGGVQDEKLVSSDIAFSVIGTYAQFKALLVDIENSLTLFEIVDIGLTEGGETQFQQFSLVVRSYALTDKDN